jgi:hypothetical protein
MKGAWLALAMMVASVSSAHAQERAHAPHKSPPIEQKFNAGAGGSRYPTKNAPLPVSIIKNAKQKHAAAAQEASTSQYHDTYLGTQISIAKSAKEQAGVTYAAIWVGGADTILTAFALLFLIRTYGQTKRMASETENSVKLAREEFNIVHRPRLVAKSFYITNYAAGNQATVSFWIFNEGDQEATIDFKGCQFFARTREASESECPDVVFDNFKHTPETIPVGDGWQYKVHIENCPLLNKHLGFLGEYLRSPESDISFEIRGEMPFTWAKKTQASRYFFDRSYDFKTQDFTWTENSEFERRS